MASRETGNLPARRSELYDEIYNVDVEAYEFPFKETFDVILFADILEHTRDPMAILRRALPALKKDGEVIVVGAQHCSFSDSTIGSLRPV